MKRGQVYYADLGQTVGHEQGGIRPCVILQNDMGNKFSTTVIIAPMTTQKKADLPTHALTSNEDYCMTRDSTILLEQLRTIEKSRIKGFVGRLSDGTMEKVDEALRASLALTSTVTMDEEEKKGDRGLNELQIFQNDEFGSVRTIAVDGDPWFVASDICKALDVQNVTQAVQKLDDDERSMFNIGRQGNANCVNEYGLYSLVLSSRKKEAREFKRWITHEVIPSIRKNGGYIAGQETLSDEELLEKAILVAQRKIEERDKIIEQQRQKIEQDKSKTIFADAVSTSKDSILIGDLAKLICQNGVQIGQKRLFDWLRQNNFLIKSGSSRNMPQQRYVEQGLFGIRESMRVDGNGRSVTTRTTVVTGKGQIYFINLFMKNEKQEAVI